MTKEHENRFAIIRKKDKLVMFSSNRKWITEGMYNFYNELEYKIIEETINVISI